MANSIARPVRSLPIHSGDVSSFAKGETGAIRCTETALAMWGDWGDGGASVDCGDGAVLQNFAFGEECDLSLSFDSGGVGAILAAGANSIHVCDGGVAGRVMS